MTIERPSIVEDEHLEFQCVFCECWGYADSAILHPQAIRFQTSLACCGDCYPYMNHIWAYEKGYRIEVLNGMEVQQRFGEKA